MQRREAGLSLGLFTDVFAWSAPRRLPVSWFCSTPKAIALLHLYVCVTVVTVQQLWEMQIYSCSELFCRVFALILLKQSLWWCCLLRTINAGWPTDTDSMLNPKTQRLHWKMCGNIPSPFCYNHILLLILLVALLVRCFVLWFSQDPVVFQSSALSFRPSEAAISYTTWGLNFSSIALKFEHKQTNA